MKLLILLICMPFVANAYIDPGSGSAIMSAIIGFFVALGIAVKTYWYKIKSFFTGSKNSDDLDEALEALESQEAQETLETHKSQETLEALDKEE